MKKKVKIFIMIFRYMKNNYIFLLVTFLFIVMCETSYNNLEAVCLCIPNKKD